MIGKALYLVSAVALVAGTAVIAQPSESGGSSQANANKQICRTMADTGSRLGRTRACHTAQEWVELRRQTKQTVDRIQNSRAMNNNCPPAC
jgi:hypothetical protein